MFITWFLLPFLLSWESVVAVGWLVGISEILPSVSSGGADWNVFLGLGEGGLTLRDRDEQGGAGEGVPRRDKTRMCHQDLFSSLRIAVER